MSATAQPAVITSWTETTPVPMSAPFTKALAYGNHVIFLLGTGTVFTGEVLPDGSVADWRETLPMPHGEVSMRSAVLVGDRVVVPSQPTSMIGRVAADGTIASWSEGPAVTSPSSDGRAGVAHGRLVFSLGGGYPYWQMVDLVEVAELLPDGTLTDWRVAGRLHPQTGPQSPLVTVIDGYLVVFGGETGNGDLAPSRNVFRAPIGADGLLGAWDFVGQLLVPRPHATFLSYRDTIHTIGGGVHSFMTAHVESSLLSEFGLTSHVAESAPLPTVWNEPAAVVVGRFGYVLGGNTCYYGGCYPTSVLMTVLGPDDLPPVLVLPEDVGVEATSGAGANVVYHATAMDNEDGSIPVTCTRGSGSLFPMGSTVVSCSATDSAGNVASGSFRVTVSDTMPPEISGATPSATTLWPPNLKMRAVDITGSVIDAADGSPSFRIVGVSCNEEAVGDWVIDGPLAVQLRAERDGGGTGRVYTVHLQAEDLAGNVSRASVQVTVPHNR
jgi:hypothetical protein